MLHQDLSVNIKGLASNNLYRQRKSIQDVNKIRDKQKNILQVAGVYYDGIDIDKSFSSFQPMIVDLEKGVYSNSFDPKAFDDKKAALDPALSIVLKERFLVFISKLFTSSALVNV